MQPLLTSLQDRISSLTDFLGDLSLAAHSPDESLPSQLHSLHQRLDEVINRSPNLLTFESNVKNYSRYLRYQPSWQYNGPSVALQKSILLTSESDLCDLYASFQKMKAHEQYVNPPLANEITEQIGRVQRLEKSYDQHIEETEYLHLRLLRLMETYNRMIHLVSQKMALFDTLLSSMASRK